MYKELSQMLYGYIIECEMFLLRTYKVNPFEIMKNMSLIDLDVYMKNIEEKEKKEQESIKKHDIMKSLFAINQILSTMFYKKH